MESTKNIKKNKLVNNNINRLNNKMKTIVALIVTFSILIACNNNQKKPTQSLAQDDKSQVISFEKQFYLGGLKFETTINLIVQADGKVSGTIKSNEYENEDDVQTVDFSGTLSDGSINIKFNGEPPLMGAASEWTDKPWRIVKKGDNDILVIIFDSKNYETNEWEETEYEFEEFKSLKPEVEGDVY